MNYEETIELEKNIKIKNEVDEILKKFNKYVKLDAGSFNKKKRMFTIWKDSHNATYLKINDDGTFSFVCDFLHEGYSVLVSEQSLFNKIKNKYRGYDHFKSMVLGFERNT